MEPPLPPSLADRLLPPVKRSRIETWCAEVSRVTFECSCQGLTSPPETPGGGGGCSSSAAGSLLSGRTTSASTATTGPSLPLSSDLCAACTRQAVLALAPLPSSLVPNGSHAKHSRRRSFWSSLRNLARGRRPSRRRESQLPAAAPSAAAAAAVNRYSEISPGFGGLAFRRSSAALEAYGFPPLGCLELQDESEDHVVFRTDMYEHLRGNPGELEGDDGDGVLAALQRSDGGLGPKAARLQRAARLLERSRAVDVTA